MSEESNKLLENLMSALGENPSETLNQMLSSLSDSEKNQDSDMHQEPEKSETAAFDFDMLMKLQGLMGAFSNTESDERSTLLCALKPFLSEEKRPQVDRAIKLLKLSTLAKTAQEMDILKNLL